MSPLQDKSSFSFSQEKRRLNGGVRSGPFSSLDRNVRRKRDVHPHRPEPPQESTVAKDVYSPSKRGATTIRYPGRSNVTVAAIQSYLHKNQERDKLSSIASASSSHGQNNNPAIFDRWTANEGQMRRIYANNRPTSLGSLFAGQTNALTLNSSPASSTKATSNSGRTSEGISVPGCKVRIGSLETDNATLVVKGNSWILEKDDGHRYPGYHIKESFFDKVSIVDTPDAKELYVSLRKVRIFSVLDDEIWCRCLHYTLPAHDEHSRQILSYVKNRFTVQMDNREKMNERLDRMKLSGFFQSYDEIRSCPGFLFDDVDIGTPLWQKRRLLMQEKREKLREKEKAKEDRLIERAEENDNSSVINGTNSHVDASIGSRITRSTRRQSALKAEEANKKLHLEAFGPDPLEYIFFDGKAQQISTSDFERLEEGEFLNDTMVNFFLKYCHQMLLEKLPDIGNKTHVFNTYFFEKLKGDENDPVQDIARAYSKVQKWTSKIDLFEKKYIIVPIHSTLHWYVAIIYNLPALTAGKQPVTVDLCDDPTSPTGKPIPPENEPCIFVLDSLKSHSNHYVDTFNKLTKYLECEANDKLKIPIDARRIKRRVPAVPQQPNYCDCGVYLIHYVQKYLQRPDQFAAMIASRSPKFKEYLKKLWSPATITGKRDQLRQLLLDLKNNPTADRPYFMLPDDA